MSIKKLRKAPLKEVIFELHWECEVDNSGVKSDIGFDLAQGKFANTVKVEFPVHKKLIPNSAHVKQIGAPIHQYWSGESKWPVVQHGQGILALNEAEENYYWADHFKPMVLKLVSDLINSYENVLKFNRIKLIYVDAFDLDDQDQVKFVGENLNTFISNNFNEPGNLKGFNIQQIFDLDNSSTISITISTGTNNSNNKKSIILTTIVERIGQISYSEINQWMDFAHKNTSETFKKILAKEFYASLT